MALDTPRATQSELAIIALCAADPFKAVEARALGLRDGDFYDRQHRQAWQALRSDADGATLLDHLERHAGRDKDGHPLTWPDGESLVAYWREVQSAPAHGHRLDRYIADLHDARARRGAMAGARATLAALEGGDSTDDILTAIQTNALQTASAIGGGFDMDSADALYAQIALDKAEGRGRDTRRLKTGIVDFDANIVLTRGDYVCLVGASGHGKTHSGLSLLAGICRTNNCGGLFVSGEMNRAQIRDRLGRHPHLEAPGLRFVFERRLDKIVSAIRVLPHQFPDLAVVVIDYWQWLNRLPKRGKRMESLHAASQEISEAGKAAGVMVILLVQADKVGIERRPKTQRVPFLTDARECKAIEHDVDVGLVAHVPGLWPDIDLAPDGLDNIAYIVARKVREGTTGGVATLWWERGKEWWRDLNSMESIRLGAKRGGKKGGGGVIL